jgi:RND family efflux transporter MFP subunit
MTATPTPPLAPDSAHPHEAPSGAIPAVIGAGVLTVLVLGGWLLHHAESSVNKVSEDATPKPVTVALAKATSFRETHEYVGTVRPWIEANVGPQFVSAYVDTVLVRPGAVVRRNDVLATLDCRNASASSSVVAAEARAIDARQKAIAHESARVNTLLDGGFVSPNEAEQKEAQSAAEEAQLSAEQAKLATTNLAVSDCILRAPFDGEVAVRSIDPGAFVRPGTPLVMLVDRGTVRMTFEVPESDFESVAPRTPLSIQLLATGKPIVGVVARRSPAADPDTRTVHVEVDLDNADRSIPVNTTGEVRVQVGQPRPSVEIPLVAASITGSKAVIYVVDGDTARRRTVAVLGEQGGSLYLDPSVPAGTRVVTEGRALLTDGDRVAAKGAHPEAALSSAKQPPPLPSDVGVAP